jgi:hypothetical protein
VIFLYSERQQRTEKIGGNPVDLTGNISGEGQKKEDFQLDIEKWFKIYVSICEEERCDEGPTQS